MPLLTNDDWRTRFARAIDRAMVRQQFYLTAFVFVPCKLPVDWRGSSTRFYLDRTLPLAPALPKLHMLPASMWE